jgi:plastocyanin
VKTSLHRTALSVVTILTFLAFRPTMAIGATVDVSIAPGGELVFSPSSVTIHPGDQVRWTFSSAGHSTTSGSPGLPNGIWDSGIRGQGATFTQTFNSTGTFAYYCIPHGGCCGMVGNVRVVSSTPTPTPPPMPGPPIVITNPATLIASFSARLNGSVNPHGLTTTFHFQYGLTTGYGLTTPPQNRSGNTPQNVSANAGNLMANRVYHFRIVASNARGTRFGVDRTFTARTPTGTPIVTTNPATNVARNSATLNSSVYPHGLSTTVNFQYGPTTSYGSTTPTLTRTGNTYQNVGANIAGLTANRVYHFRIKATNMAGTRFGNDRTFTTRP